MAEPPQDGHWIRRVDPDVDYEEQPDGSWGLFCEARRGECGKPATWMIGDEEEWRRKRAKVFCGLHAVGYCRNQTKIKALPAELLESLDMGDV